MNIASMQAIRISGRWVMGAGETLFVMALCRLPAFLFSLSISASVCAESIRPHILPLPAANRTIWTDCYGVTFCCGFFTFPHPSADAVCGANLGKLNQLILFIKLGTLNVRVLYLP
ncbi:hypothetical protein M8494_12155 [Serratia ureilytica]